MKRILVRLIISLLIGAAFLYLAAGRIEFRHAWTAIKAANWNMLLPYVLCMMVQHFFRAWRWGQLLAPIHPVSFGRILPISSVGFLAIVALPLRMGEFVRPYLIADPPHIRMSHGLGTMAVERVFDGVFLSLAAFTAVMEARSRGVSVPAWVLSAGLAALGVFCIALVVLIMTLWQRERAVTLCHSLFSIFSKRLADKAASIAEGIVEGFRVLPNIRRLGLFLGATAAYWFLNALALWIIARGFDLQISVGAAVGLIGMVGIGIMIPAGPGFIGNFELFAEGALGLYLPRSVLDRTGAGFILAAHTTNAGWYLITGLLALLSRHVTFSRVVQASSSPTPDDEVAEEP
ncbi:MAG: flippase-like domain-containing protein [Deltaproteobacteria bacterium]|nr:flippase-like domain-containing protein [Deltaproteobacteria bacterium]